MSPRMSPRQAFAPDRDATYGGRSQRGSAGRGFFVELQKTRLAKQFSLLICLAVC